MSNYRGVFYRKFALCSAFLLFLIVVSTTGGKISKGKDCKHRKGLLEDDEVCVSRGGICVKRNQCPKNRIVGGKEGCPKQESGGIVCCHKAGRISKGKDCKHRKGLLQNDKPCLSKGGICVKADQCPKNQVAEGKGLCPKQESSGVVCCHKGPESPDGRSSCKGEGGECMNEKDCKGTRTDYGKADCKEGEWCCILIHY